VKGRIAASFAAWLVAVAFVASIAWLAIDTAGQQVTAAQAAVPLPTNTRTARPTPDAATATTKAAKHKKASKKPTPTATLVPTITAGPPSPGAGPISNSFSSEVGRIRLTCTGSAISLDGGYAQPASGWSLKIAVRQSARIVFDFFASGRQGVAVAADCVKGEPRFYTHRLSPHSPPNHPNPSASAR
jgi:hypothetical protein